MGPGGEIVFNVEVGDGKRDFALASWRTDSDHHSAGAFEVSFHRLAG